MDHETGSPIDPATRWFRLLRERNHPHTHSPVVIDHAGAALSEWQLVEPAMGCAALCGELQRSHPIAPIGWFQRKATQDPVGLCMLAVGAVLLLVLLFRLGAR